MPKYLLLKHYRGGPEPHHPFPPMDQWAPEDVEAHMAFQRHVTELLEESGEYVGAQALMPARTWVRYGGPDAAPVTTDGPHPETSDLVAGWFMIDVESPRARAGGRGVRLLRARPPRRADVRVDRRPGGHVRHPVERLTRRDDDRRADRRGRAARPRPAGARRPGPAGRGLRRRRGRAPGGAAGGAPGLARAPAGRPARVADHGRDAAARRRAPQRGSPPAPRGDDLRRAAAGPHGGGRRHAVRALLLLPPRPRARLPGRPDTARRRRPHHAREGGGGGREMEGGGEGGGGGGEDEGDGGGGGGGGGEGRGEGGGGWGGGRGGARGTIEAPGADDSPSSGWITSASSSMTSRGAIEFFTELGLEVQGRFSVRGAGGGPHRRLEGVKNDAAMMQTPDGHGRRAIQFNAPPSRGRRRDAPRNTRGLRHLCFAVDDIEDTIARLWARARRRAGRTTGTASGSATSVAPRGSSSRWPRRSAERDSFTTAAGSE